MKLRDPRRAAEIVHLEHGSPCKVFADGLGLSLSLLMPLSLLPPQPVCAITTSAASNRAQNLLIGFPPREREKKRLLARHDISVRARADIFLRANADNRCRCARNARE